MCSSVEKLYVAKTTDITPTYSIFPKTPSSITFPLSESSSNPSSSSSDSEFGEAFPFGISKNPLLGLMWTPDVLFNKELDVWKEMELVLFTFLDKGATNGALAKGGEVSREEREEL
ncbi:hypothetical protein WICPIJ_002711 [Wickerhamomyces pijperi]|uniref:Uncharacterized protein n=1 Tax=Wickerhamomyces pijperi TaxID=599730 RepID=A0A9P8QBD6_WICPI|nr:hypothetical protein WICPIJ_002711 [Wickerhamomyces pijperi]